MYVMHDVPAQPAHRTGAVSAVAFDWTTVRQACRDAGATTNEECAALMGVSIATLDRIRKRPDSPTLRTASRIAQFVGKRLDDVFPPTPVRHRHEMSEAA